MKDYETFLTTYTKVNECLLGLYGRYDLSLFDMPNAKTYLLTKEVVPYATLLYAMNLLSQVVVTHFSSSLQVLSDNNKNKLFPEIYGILSMANMHVCPAVPAAIVIYSAMEEFDVTTFPWSQKLEQQVWNENIDDFNAAVSWVLTNMSGSLNLLCGQWIDEIKTSLVAKKYLEEHEKIKDEIHKLPLQTTRVTNF